MYRGGDKAGHAERCAASERRGNNFKGLQPFDLKFKARVWPGTSYVCHIRSIAESHPGAVKLATEMMNEK
jgi:hypothetical protein